MFGNKRFGKPIDETEWEELRYDADVSEAVHPDTYDSDGRLPEYSLAEEDVPAQVLSSRLFQEGTESPLIDLDCGSIDVSMFPALRMAYGIIEDESNDELQNGIQQSDRDTDDSELIHYMAQSDGEEGMFALICQYAGLDEQDNAEEKTETNIVSMEEELPALFVLQQSQCAETALPEEFCDPEADEFTMESEIEKQRMISGELFSYIDFIEMDSAAEAEQREHARRTAANRKAYDPYNMKFNSRYEDMEDSLEEIPEIPLEPKFRLE